MALVGMLLGGCASTLQSRKIDKEDLQTTVLVTPSVLEKGKEGEALYRYINPKVDWKNYPKIILDPVVVYQEASLDAETRATDSVTGELLAAALDTRVGGKQLRNAFRGTWQDADSGLMYWAELTRYCI
jgi:hypothetical protein